MVHCRVSRSQKCHRPPSVVYTEKEHLQRRQTPYRENGTTMDEHRVPGACWIFVVTQPSPHCPDCLRFAAPVHDASARPRFFQRPLSLRRENGYPSRFKSRRSGFSFNHSAFPPFVRVLLKRNTYQCVGVINSCDSVITCEREIHSEPTVII